jgi:hydroxymethylpyrimidine/phosphomethylpyrimidine kinase
MGVSKLYWIGILNNIYRVAGAGEFTWTEMQERGMSKSELSRLKCSNFIIKGGKTNYKGMVKWRLNPDAINSMKSYSLMKKKSRK